MSLYPNFNSIGGIIVNTTDETISNPAVMALTKTRFQSLIYGDIFDMVEMDPDETEVGIS